MFIFALLNNNHVSIRKKKYIIMNSYTEELVMTKVVDR